MEQNFQYEQKEKEIDLASIFKLLLSKIKVLLYVALAGLIVGCSLGALTSFSSKQYGAPLQYYVNPKSSGSTTDSDSQYAVYGAYNSTVMDNMVKLLQSDAFAEKLLLDEYGLPKEYRNNEIYTKAVNAVKKLRETENEIENTQKQIVIKNRDIPILKEEVDLCKTKFDVAVSHYDKTWSNYLMILEHGGSNQQDELKKILTNAEADYYAKNEDYNKALNNYNTAKTDILKLESDLNEATMLLNQRQVEADSETETLLAIWREHPNYKPQLNKVKSSVKYSYLKDEDLNSNNANNFARSFFYVEISVLNDEGFAENLLDAVNRILPTYIEDKMIVPDGYSGTNCINVSRLNQIEDLSASSVSSQIVKYGLVAAVAAVLLACLIIILKDNANKQLRNYDELSRTLRLPVLGVIPTIPTPTVEAKLANTKKEEK